MDGPCNLTVGRSRNATTKTNPHIPYGRPINRGRKNPDIGLLRLRRRWRKEKPARTQSGKKKVSLSSPSSCGGRRGRGVCLSPVCRPPPPPFPSFFPGFSSFPSQVPTAPSKSQTHGEAASGRGGGGGASRRSCICDTPRSVGPHFPPLNRRRRKEDEGNITAASY